MLRYIGKVAGDTWDDLSYSLGRATSMIVGKEAISRGVPEVVSLIAPFIVGLITRGAGDAARTTAAMIGKTIAYPLVVAFSAGLAQVDHMHRRHKIKESYKNEIGALVGKKPDDVTEQDMEIVAHGDYKRGIKPNKTIADALEHSAKERTIGMVISSVATVGVIFAVTAICTAVGVPHVGLKEVGAAISSGSAGEIATQAASFAFKACAGVATYVALKTPMHWVGAEVLGLEKETASHKIKDIRKALKRGKAITQEQVFEVWKEAHPEIEEGIKRDYGRDFEQLNSFEKRAVLTEAGALLPLERETANINLKRVRPEELAFEVIGQESGYAGGEGAPPTDKGFMHKCWDALCGLVPVGMTGNAVHTHSENKTPEPTQTDRLQAAYASAPEAATQQAVAMDAFEQNSPRRHSSYVEMVGGAKTKDGTDISYMQRVVNEQIQQHNQPVQPGK